MSFVIRVLLFVLLTVATQIGGIAYLISLPLRQVSRQWIRHRLLNAAVCFLVVYAGVWYGAANLAPLVGRYPIPCFGNAPSHLMMQSPMYCMMNRNYVRSDLLQIAEELAHDVDQKFPGTKTLALDAGFPFLDGFPLLPHLSHDDGNKLDLAFYYADLSDGYQIGKTKSPIGYWAFELPKDNQRDACAAVDAGFSMRWEMAWFSVLNNDLVLEPKRTAYAIRWLAQKGRRLGVTKVFVEPHLLSELGLSGQNLKFQGCYAARHDDHIHFQTD
ncbi:hypothetical protein [Thalassospira lucentensis]|uniref:hypothetical protein n=1 Tax=Thalassospira lucentensis TaxID=168935 RepID=UPI00142E3DA0|nr:hypothetical protein [Thalassospira lucentensis]NIZ00967.1 hypothetical protein [Thalassospira lucentensis]